MKTEVRDEVERAINLLPRDFLDVYTYLTGQGCSHDVANQAALEIMQRRAKLRIEKAREEG